MAMLVDTHPGMFVYVGKKQVWHQLQKAGGKQKRAAKGGGKLHQLGVYPLFGRY
jgi:hypothetical protein